MLQLLVRMFKLLETFTFLFLFGMETEELQSFRENLVLGVMGGIEIEKLQSYQKIWY
jgi:hypothetical protein